jgi:hypothetical protein
VVQPTSRSLSVQAIDRREQALAASVVMPAAMQLLTQSLIWRGLSWRALRDVE